MIRAALLLLLAVPSDIAELIAKLRDPATRDEAARALVERGTPALAELRAAAADPKIDAIVKEIETREPRGLRFEAKVSPDRELSVDITNRGAEKLVLWPYFSLRILDAKGQPVKPKTHIGRWGRGRSGQWLADVKFVTLAPGEKWGFKAALSRYDHDVNFIEGWEALEPGAYTVEVTYRFERAATKRTCDPKWEALDDAEQPWNRALEMTHVFTAELVVAGP